MNKQDIAGQKQSLRKKFDLMRKDMPQQDITAKSRIIIDSLMSLKIFRTAENIMLYASLDYEVSTHELIRTLLELDEKAVMLPFIDKEDIKIAEISSYSELRKAGYGILEPEDKFESARMPDIIIMPGTAFDPKGRRLGFGKGCYDRFLIKHPDIPKIALAFERQIIEDIPCECHDIGVDLIVTEKRNIRCNTSCEEEKR